jgi:thiamine transport system ATP-binding protein
MLSIERISARHGDRIVLDDLTLATDRGEVLAVLGPSGSGKSTLLRVIAGLHTPDHGRVRIDSQDVTGVPTHRRGIGLMFQQHALLPHRDVAGNVGFGPRMQGLSAREVAARIAEALELVDLVGTDARDVTTLSGGEQQRVALARAIAARPRLLLLDEPLGSLDRDLRTRLLGDLPTVLERLGVTTVTVTHDQEEAMVLADRIAVIADGRLLRVDSPEALWDDPQDPFVATFLGLGPLLAARVRSGLASTAYGDLPAPGAPDGDVRLALLAGALRPREPQRDGADATDAPDATEGPTTPGALRVRVATRRFAGDRVLAEVEPDRAAAPGAAGPTPRLTIALSRTSRVAAGHVIVVDVDPSRVRWFAPGPSAAAEPPVRQPGTRADQ